MSLEVILTIISLLLQVIGILIAIVGILIEAYGYTELNDQTDTNKKMGFNPTNKSDGATQSSNTQL